MASEMFSLAKVELLPSTPSGSALRLADWKDCDCLARESEATGPVFSGIPWDVWDATWGMLVLVSWLGRCLKAL